jgi:hypothetical protein
MCGVIPMDINSLQNEKNIGFIIPVNIKKEFYRNLFLIKTILAGRQQLAEIKEFLIQKNKENLILGDLEIPINLCMDILDTNLFIKNNTEFNPINNIVFRYNKFLSIFTNGKYNDIDLILEYLPDIIFKLISLKCI